MLIESFLTFYLSGSFKPLPLWIRTTLAKHSPRGSKSNATSCLQSGNPRRSLRGLRLHGDGSTMGGNHVGNQQKETRFVWEGTAADWRCTSASWHRRHSRESRSTNVVGAENEWFDPRYRDNAEDKRPNDSLLGDVEVLHKVCAQWRNREISLVLAKVCDFTQSKLVAV